MPIWCRKPALCSRGEPHRDTF